MSGLSRYDFEAGWSRRETFRALDQRTILKLLAPVFDEQSIERVEPLSGGKANSNFRVSVAGVGDVVLRVYTRDAKASLKETELLRLLQGRVAVPSVVYFDSDPLDFDYPYAVLSWSDGVSLMEAFASGQDAHGLGSALGAALAAIHLQQLDFADPLDGQLSPTNVSFLDYIEECLQDRNTTLDAAFVARASEFVRSNSHLLPSRGEPQVLVHGDYKAGNLIVDRDVEGWRVSGVLDWEFAFLGPALFDFAALLRFADRMPAGFQPGVAHGYRGHGGVLPPDWQRRVRLLDFANLCDFARQPGRGGKLTDDVSERLLLTMDQWDALEDS